MLKCLMLGRAQQAYLHLDLSLSVGPSVELLYCSSFSLCSRRDEHASCFTCRSSAVVALGDVKWVVFGGTD